MPTEGDTLSSAAHGLAHLVRIVRARLASSVGQGTVEYVGLILLVSLLMVGMVAAMKGFSGESGLDIAEVIVAKIKSAVQAITFSD
jgi:hypothetical protein